MNELIKYLYTRCDAEFKSVFKSHCNDFLAHKTTDISYMERIKDTLFIINITDNAYTLSSYSWFSNPILLSKITVDDVDDLLALVKDSFASEYRKAA